MADKLKLWCVRRWLHLLPLEELQKATKDKYLYQQFDGFHKKSASAMIANFYKHTAGNDLVLDDHTSDPAYANPSIYETNQSPTERSK